MFCLRWEVKTAALREFSRVESEGKASAARGGLREISVRKFTCDQIPPSANLCRFLKGRESLNSTRMHPWRFIDTTSGPCPWHIGRLVPVDRYGLLKVQNWLLLDSSLFKL